MPEEKYEFLHKVIAEEQELDISIDRVDKLEAPLLVIGLGGTGSEAVHVIKSTFAKRYNLPVDANGNAIPVPLNTAYLVIDSDNGSQGSLATHEYQDISVSGLASILDPRSRSTHPWENEWLNKYLDTDAVGAGAGTYRQAARLMLSRSYNNVVGAISNKLHEICTVTQGHGGNTGLVNIVIVTGISGGTGSGTFLDVAQIVRSVMDRDAMLNSLTYRVSAYLVMPDVSCSVVNASHPLQTAFKSNSYAALKELDFWMGYDSKHKTKYTMQYTADPTSRITWVKPFDACSLMSGTTFQGVPYTQPKKVVFNSIAENLLHYLANENNGLDANGNPKHTYISYEDNLRAAVGSLNKLLPANHCYRAIGAYTKKIPKKKILYYEATHLFGTFMPGRNQHGKIMPVTSLILRATSRADIIDICGDLPGHYKRFTDVAKLPQFCNIQLDDTNQVEAMRNMRPTPHEQENIGTYPWRDSVLLPKARECADQYLDIAWKNFTVFATNIITDPQFGPYALLEYLSKETNNSLRKSLQELVQNWAGTESNFRSSLNGFKNNCNAAWPAFVKPPLFGQRGALENYKQSLFSYYDGIRRAEFAGTFAKAIEKFAKRVDEYRDQSLSQLCKALDEMDNDFKTVGAEVDDTSSELFSLDDVKKSLDDSFVTNNANQRITREFLSMLSEASFVTEKNPDIHSSGVSFVFARTSSASIRNSLRAKLEQCFGGVNAASMDQILIDRVGDDVQVRQAEMDKLGKSIMKSACPMFSKNPSTAGTPYAEFTYLSIPDNAPGYLQYYSTSLGDKVEPKSSCLRDHIFCLNTYDGMPIYMYSQMEDLEMAYADRLTVSSQSKGLHLVWNGDLDSDVTINWTKLPAPRPFYYFGPSGSPADMKKFEDAQKLAQRAIDCGMLTINDDMPKPTYTVRLKYTDGGMAAPKSSALIRQETDAIDLLKNPVTNSPLTEVEKLQPLLNYQAEAVVKTVTETVNPMCMQKYLGLEGQPCDPFADIAAANPVTFDIAKKNHKKLCQVLVVAMLCDDPVTYLAMENQIEGMEYLQSKINNINSVVNAWEPRIEYADKVAKMLIFKLVSIRRGTIGYTLDGMTTALIEPQLLKDELKNQDNYTKCAGYLADLSVENPVRYALEHALKGIEEELDQLNMKMALPEERSNEIYEAAKELQGELQEEIQKQDAASRTIGADMHLIGKVKGVLNNMQQIATRFVKDYRP